jgi:hypothetical protein
MRSKEEDAVWADVKTAETPEIFGVFSIIGTTL